jgi:hypothetical protein
MITTLLESKMIDVKGWINRARAFTQSLEQLPGETILELSISPASDDPVMDNSSREWRVDLPDQIGNFLLKGSADCRFHYVWTPPVTPARELKEVFPDQSYIYGGGSVCKLADFKNSQDACAWWFLGGKLDGKGLERLVPWLSSFPFLPTENGDYLALDVETNWESPPVLYLNHECTDDIQQVAATFEHFLTEWEKLCYIGPEIWMLDLFRDPISGHLDGDSQKAEALRRLFRLSD